MLGSGEIYIRLEKGQAREMGQSESRNERKMT
jgi:hypothetical protein